MSSSPDTNPPIFRRPHRAIWAIELLSLLFAGDQFEL